MLTLMPTNFWKRGERVRLAEHLGIDRSLITRFIAKGVRDPERAKELEEATAEVLGADRTIPARCWVMRDEFPHMAFDHLDGGADC